MSQPFPIDPQAGLASGFGLSRARPWAAVEIWDDLSRLLLFCLLVIAVLTFRDYGISIDEEVQHIYGKKLLAYYTSGFVDLSAFSFKDLYLYGGLFDLAVALLTPISPLAEYDTRHLLCALCGVVGIAGTWRLGRLLGGPRAGFLAAALLALSGVYYGAMFNNTKDVPFAAGMVWTLYFATRMVLQFPSPRPSSVLKFGLTLGLSLGIRVGAVLAGVYVVAAALLFLAFMLYSDGWRATLAAFGRMVVAMLPAVPVAYGLMAALWPWAVFDVLNPIRALQAFSHIDYLPYQLETLFNGRLVSAIDAPALYLPVYLAIKVPEAVLLGLLLAVAFAAAWVWRTVRERRSWRPALRYAVVTLAVAFPIASFMLLRPTVYNGIRHFLFVVPPMVVLAAVAFHHLWNLAEARGHHAVRAVVLGLTVSGVVYGWQLGCLHPNEYVYYNAFVGGAKGAKGRFELDYWGNSILEAVKQLESLLELENDGKTPERTYTVVVCGNALAARYELPPYLKLVNGVEPLWRNADFFITFTQDRICPNLMDGRPIIEILADEVPLAIVKDRRAPEQQK
ncbi:glycosyltransferase family 39 protein [Azospirillum sp.]|uniref:glycosyltransferase family 39 protein n=1 Tax=Azospirillum sp. TaxID=34012 RepID=UPI002D2B4C1C|nr:glycosyltransferase family 39 protein [Azospirillum sp.]HYD66236.1 glycosyltransferase family 39 protein [Azospirillum sp.]